MDGFQPYTNPSYQAPTSSWANANVYAPWDPDGAGSVSGGPSTNGANPFTSYGQTTEQNPWDAFNPGAWNGDMFSLDPQTSASGMGLGWWDFKGGKKRPNITYNAPSYQGNIFTPQEGLPQYYGPSAEGGGANQNLMGTMGMGGGGSSQYGSTTSAPQASPNMAGGFYGSASPVSGGGSGYDNMMPSFIGQSPWGMDSGYSGYGTGYGNNGSAYGSYGSSGGTQSNMSKGTSLYQPYVPTGGSGGFGQY